MAVNHVVINGETILDMRGATATAADITDGVTAYGASGELLVGTAKPGGGTLTINAPAGCTATITKGTDTKSATVGSSGEVTFTGLESGEWEVTIDSGNNTASRTVTITTDYSVTMEFFSATISVTYPEGSTCTCSDGSTTLTAPDTSGSCTFTVPNAGTWTVNCVDGTESDSQTVTITAQGQSVNITLGYNRIPKFTYTGSYKIVNDDGETITTSKDNWRIRFLTSGTLKFTDLNGAADGIDVFCCGGGGDGGNGHDTYDIPGAGGGGGYTKTLKGVSVAVGTSYTIKVGGSGGKSSGFGCSANGGLDGTGDLQSEAGHEGGDGGSGGNAPWATGTGGTDGGNGTSYTNNGTRMPGGTGQGKTTREFGESSGPLYATGGSGGSSSSGTGKSGASNTGNGGRGGGGAGAAYGGSGGSGIVVIRNKR